MLLRSVDEINLFVDTVNELAKIDTGFHIVIDVRKHITNHKLFEIAIRYVQFLQFVEQFVHKFNQGIASNTFFIIRPITPSEALWDGTATVLGSEFPLHFLGIKSF